MSKINFLLAKKHKKAFTLVEIILVIAILGIISSVALSKLSGFSEKARLKTDLLILDTLNKASALYLMDNLNNTDIFKMDKSYPDQDRINDLYTAGFLTNNLMESENKKGNFKWNIENKNGNIKV